MQNLVDDVPMWLWRLVRAGLAVIMILGAAGVLALAAGAADPPRAGRLIWDDGPLREVAVPARSSFTLDSIVELPAPPFTLEITAQFAARSDPAAAWGLQFNSAASGVMLDGYRFMAVLPGDLAPFIHVRGPGESNKITLDVASQNQVTLRINDEIAWSGIISSLRTIKIVARGGAENSAWLTV